MRVYMFLCVLDIYRSSKTISMDTDIATDKCICGCLLTANKVVVGLGVGFVGLLTNFCWSNLLIHVVSMIILRYV